MIEVGRLSEPSLRLCSLSFVFALLNSRTMFTADSHAKTLPIAVLIRFRNQTRSAP